MKRMTVISTIVGVMSFAMTIDSAHAQSTNSSNASGANNTNAYGLLSDVVARSASYNSTVINQAKALASELSNAEQAFANAQQQLDQAPDYYARRPVDCNCQNPQQSRLDEARGKAMSFLKSIQNPTPDLLDIKSSGSRQSW